jgi:hypothetical protein
MRWLPGHLLKGAGREEAMRKGGGQKLVAACLDGSFQMLNTFGHVLLTVIE